MTAASEPRTVIHGYTYGKPTQIAVQIVSVCCFILSSSFWELRKDAVIIFNSSQPINLSIYDIVGSQGDNILKRLQVCCFKFLKPLLFYYSSYRWLLWYCRKQGNKCWIFKAMLCIMEIGTKRKPAETGSVAVVPSWLMSLWYGLNMFRQMSQMNSDMKYKY